MCAACRSRTPPRCSRWPGDEAEPLLVADLGVAVTLHPLGDGGERLCHVGRPGLREHQRGRPRPPHLTKEVQVYLLHGGQVVLNRNFDTKFLQMRKHILPARVATEDNLLWAVGLSRRRSAHGSGQQIGQVVHVRGVVHRDARQRFGVGAGDDQPKVMGVRLAVRLWHRPEVGLPSVVTLREPLDVRLDEGRPLAEFQFASHGHDPPSPILLRRNSTRLSASSVPIRSVPPSLKWTTTHVRPHRFHTQPPRMLR